MLLRNKKIREQLENSNFNNRTLSRFLNISSIFASRGLFHDALNDHDAFIRMAKSIVIKKSPPYLVSELVTKPWQDVKRVFVKFWATVKMQNTPLAENRVPVCFANKAIENSRISKMDNYMSHLTDLTLAGVPFVALIRNVMSPAEEGGRKLESAHHHFQFQEKFHATLVEKVATCRVYVRALLPWAHEAGERGAAAPWF